MPNKLRKFDREFREGALRIVQETKKPIAMTCPGCLTSPLVRACDHFKRLEVH